MAQAFRIDMRHDFGGLQRRLTRLERKVLPKAQQAALNKAAVSVRSAAAKELARETGLKQTAVRGAIRLFKANRNRLEAVLEARGRPLNMIRFMTPAQIRTWMNSPKRPRPPLRAKPWGKKRAYRRRVFIGNQGRTVFIREGKTRLPIRGLYGPSIARELVRKAVKSVIDKRIADRWPIEFRRALANEVRKHRRRK